jgi:hypothetical protein
MPKSKAITAASSFEKLVLVVFEFGLVVFTHSSDKPMKKYAFLLLIGIILLVFTNQFGRDEFNEKIANLEQSLNKEDWDFAKKQMDDLNSYSDHNLWKLQLVGGEAEYKDLYKTFSRLSILIEEKNRRDSKVELQTVKTLIDHIYSI